MDQTILKSHVEKSKDFKGSGFLRWQQKMLFYLTSLHVSCVFTDSKQVDLYMVDGQNVPTEAQFKQLVLKIRVEEDNRMNEKADANSIEPNANIVGESSFKSKSKHKNKCKKGGGSGKKSSKDEKKDYTKQKNNNFKKVYHCWVCATKHIYSSRRMFVSYQKVNEPEPMFMGNETTLKIKGKGKVILELTSGKDLVHSNVLNVPNITKNLTSGPILSNKGFKLVFE
ncbi:hypothetical protein Tco_0929118 [Tanacetum coccineum]